MKHDLDLIRKILLAREDQDHAFCKEDVGV